LESMRRKECKSGGHHRECNCGEKISSHDRPDLPAAGLTQYLENPAAPRLGAMFVRKTLRQKKVERSCVCSRHGRREEERSFWRYPTQHSADKRTENEAEPEGGSDQSHPLRSFLRRSHIGDISLGG